MHFSFSLITISRAFWINRNGLICLESTPSKSLKNLLKKSHFLSIFCSGPKFEHISQERRNDMVNMIDNATFIICDDNPISVILLCNLWLQFCKFRI